MAVGSCGRQPDGQAAEREQMQPRYKRESVKMQSGANLAWARWYAGGEKGVVQILGAGTITG